MNKPLTAMEMVDKKQRDKKFKQKRKLFDDSESERSESSSEEESNNKINSLQGKKSNVVKKIIFNEPIHHKKKENPIEKDPFPKEIEEILNSKKNELEFIIQNDKREYDI